MMERWLQAGANCCDRCKRLPPEGVTHMGHALEAGWFFTPPTSAPDAPDAYCPECAEFLRQAFGNAPRPEWKPLVGNCISCRYYREKAHTGRESWGVCDNEEAGKLVRVSGINFLRSVVESDRLDVEMDSEILADIIAELRPTINGNFGCRFWQEPPE